MLKFSRIIKTWFGFWEVYYTIVLVYFILYYCYYYTLNLFQNKAKIETIEIMLKLEIETILRIRAENYQGSVSFVLCTK